MQGSALPLIAQITNLERLDIRSQGVITQTYTWSVMETQLNAVLQAYQQVIATVNVS